MKTNQSFLFALIVLFLILTIAFQANRLSASDDVLDEIPDIGPASVPAAKKEPEPENATKMTSKLYAGVRLGENIASVRKNFRVLEEQEENDVHIVYVEPKWRWFLVQGMAFKNGLCTDIEVVYNEPTLEDINEFYADMRKQFGPLKKSTNNSYLFAGNDNDITVYASLKGEADGRFLKLVARWSVIQDYYERPDFDFRPAHINKKRRKPGIPYQHFYRPFPALSPPPWQRVP